MKERPILFSAPMVRALLDGSKTQTRRAIKRPLAHPGWTSYRYFGPSKNNPTCQSKAIECGPDYPDGKEDCVLCPYGSVGDQLWVRETFYCDDAFYPNGVTVDSHWREVDGKRVAIPMEEQRADMLESIYYRADGEPEWEGAEGPTPWRPSIHMPRWVSRITLEITSVRVERLQDISEADCIAEGIMPHVRGGVHWHKHDPADLDDWHQFGFKTTALAYEDLWESINGAGSWALNPWVWVIEFKRLKP